MLLPFFCSSRTVLGCVGINSVFGVTGVVYSIVTGTVAMLPSARFRHARVDHVWIAARPASSLGRDWAGRLGRQHR